jgi:aminoglycoside 3'-phosphotransferase II
MNIRRAKGHGRYATLAIEMPEFSQSWHVKVRPASDSAKQADEAARTRWAHERLPAPTHARAVRLPGISMLITKTLEGRPSHKYIGILEPTAILSGLASAIGVMLLTNAEDFPFAQPSWATEQGMAKNLRRLETSKTKHQGLHSDFAGRTYRELREIMDGGPGSDDKVLAHGDLCMPNVLLRGNAALAGIVDLGGLHAGDPQLDLAIMSWTVQANMGNRWANRLLEMHGATAAHQGILYNRLAYDLGLERPDPWAWTQAPQLAEQRKRLSA